jgi:subtilisin family serine protease
MTIKARHNIMKHKLLYALLFTALFILSDSLVAQKYWVVFKNKTGTPYSVSTPSAYLGPKAISRRANQGIAIDNTDLPVTPAYVSQIDGVSGVTILHRSKWMNGVVISVTNTTAITTINTFSFVQTTSPVNRYKLNFPAIEKPTGNQNTEGLKSQQTTTFNYGGALNQTTMINADCLHNQGFRGQGIIIAVMDAGFDYVDQYDIFDSLWLQNRVLGSYDFIANDTNVYSDHSHGANVLSAMAGLKPGTIIGTAPKASYWLLRTEDGGSETISEEYNWIRAAEFADSVGADICTTSLGYTTFDGNVSNHTYSQLDGRTAPMSIASTMATRKGMIVLNAAGNEGGGSWNFIAVPADADSIITVGAVDGSKNKAGFSSFGPTADGRIKPDLSAQGAGCWVCYQPWGCFPGNGTSFATPVLAGGVACLLQLKKFATPMQIIGALKASADSVANPNNRVGWGVPHLCAAASHSLLAVKENTKDVTVSVYPNPFSSELNIALQNIPSKNFTITIRNILGQTVYFSEYVNESAKKIIHLSDTKDLKAGVYFVSFDSKEFNISKKVVKQ